MNRFSEQVDAVAAAYSMPAIHVFPLCPPSPPGARVGMSKFGGRPNLPLDLDWPRGADPYPNPDMVGSPNPPLHFLAQIDCGDLPGGPDALPRTGTLFFFARMDDEAVWDDEDPADGMRVLYTAQSVADVPERDPPADTWLVNARGVPVRMTTGRHDDHRLTTDVVDKRTFPEWPVSFHAYTHIVDSETLDYHGGLPSDLGQEDRAAFLEAFRDVRNARLKAALPAVRSATSLAPSENLDEAEERRRRAAPWRYLPEPLEGLRRLNAYVLEVAAHLGAEFEDVPERLDREKPVEFHAEERAAAAAALEQAKVWIERTERGALGDEVPDDLAASFVAWLEEISAVEQKRWIVSRVLKDEEGRPKRVLSRTPLFRVDRPHRLALIEIARKAALHVDLHAKVPASLYDLCPFGNIHRSDMHQMLGHFASCDAAFAPRGDKVHLLRLGTEEMLHWLFWDCGEATFFIKAADLEARRFDRAWASIQG